MAEYDQMGNYGGYNDSYGYDTMDMAQPVSPQFYDDFGNPVANAEEEKRKREEIERQIEAYKQQQKELGSEVSQKQEVTTYADGSQTITTKREVPGQRSQAIQPVSPDYNARIAQQESGNRPDIGYHNQQLSSAYGPYGITQGAYADARRENPNLPQDIRQATPDQMTAAQNQVTANNSRYLQNYGVPVNEKTLSAAHFLGAKGLSDFLKTGYISPQAAQANGGIENVKRIVQQRLGGQPAPASGAVQQPQPQQQVQQQQQPRPRPQPITPEQSQQQAQQAQQTEAQAEPAEAPRMAPNSFDEFGTPKYSPEQANLDRQLKTYESIQNDPRALMNFEGPEWMQNNAKMRAADILANERGNQKAEETLKTASSTDLANYLRSKKDDDMSIRIKGMLFALAGNKEMANQMLMKLDTVGTDKYVQGADGKAYMLKTRADGEIIKGFNAETGQQLTENELVKVGAGTQGAGKLNIVGGSYVNDTTKEVGRLVTDERTGMSYIQTDTGRKPMAGFRPQGQAGTLDMQKAQQIQKQNLDLQADWAKAQIAIAKAGPEEAAKLAGAFNFKYQTNFAPPQFTGAAPQISMETGQMVQAAPTATTVGAQGATTAAAPVSLVAPAVQTQPGAAPAPAAGVQTQPARPQPVSPADVESQREREKKERESQQAINQAVTIDKAKDYGTYYNTTAQPQAATGAQISSIRKQQLSGPDGLVNVPEIAALMQGKGGTADAIQDIFRDMVTAGAYKNNQEMAEDLNRRIASLKLDSLPTQQQRERARNALYMQVRLQNQLAPLTIRDTAPVGAISDSEQRMNINNQVDILKNPAYVSLNLLSKNKFNQDKNQARASMIEERQDFKDLATFNKEWTKESARLDKMYDDIYSARAAYIAKYKNTPAAALDAYKHYPEPSWDAEKKKWTYTGYSYRPNLNSFVK